MGWDRGRRELLAQLADLPVSGLELGAEPADPATLAGMMGSARPCVIGDRQDRRRRECGRIRRHGGASLLVSGSADTEGEPRADRGLHAGLRILAPLYTRSPREPQGKPEVPRRLTLDSRAIPWQMGTGKVAVDSSGQRVHPDHNSCDESRKPSLSRVDEITRAGRRSEPAGIAVRTEGRRLEIEWSASRAGRRLRGLQRAMLATVGGSMLDPSTDRSEISESCTTFMEAYLRGPPRPSRISCSRSSRSMPTGVISSSRSGVPAGD